MNRRFSAAALVLVVGIGLAACGIPDETDVRPEGKAPAQDFALGGVGSGEPPGRTDSTSPEGFATNFLQAAAGEPAGAEGRVRDFIAPFAQGQLRKPGPEVNIHLVRLTQKPTVSPGETAGSSVVTIRVQQVGVLRANGSLNPPTVGESEYTFTVGEVENEMGLFVTDPPPVLLLSEDALKAYYEQRTLYFWDIGENVLVPDLRYLPKAVPRERQPTELLNWLIKGPSPWLQSSVRGLPSGTKANGNVPSTNSRLQVDLSTEAAPPGDDEQLQRLGDQLMWSLRPYLDLKGGLELKIEGQTRRVFQGENYLKANPSNLHAESPQRFCVYGGQVRQIFDADDQPDSAPVLAPEVNRDIVAAALARNGDVTTAALVVSEGAGKQRLAVGPVTSDAFQWAKRTYASMSRPVWLEGAQGIGLIVADGRLYQFHSDASLTAPLNLPGATGTLNAVGMAPDGRRIAFVAGGQLYVAGLVRDDENAVEVQPARRVLSSLHDLTAVDWRGENLLVVAGQNAQDLTVLYDLTVDGAQEFARDFDLGTAKVTHLAAYPDDPATSIGAGPAMFVVSGAANNLYNSGPARIEPSEIGGEVKAGAGNPTAPFFLY